MECGKLTAKLRDAVPVCFIVDGREIKRFKNIEIPDEIKKLPYKDFEFNVPLTGAITFKITFETGILPEVWPEARQRKQRAANPHSEVQTTEATIKAAIQESLAQTEAEGQPVQEIADRIEHGAEISAAILDNENTITAEEPESMAITYNLTGERRKALTQAVSQYTGEKPIYQNAPTFAYKIGSYTIDKNGALTGPNTPALIESLKMQGFIAE